VTRQKLTPPDQATFQRAATPSRPHSQHPWRCRKYDRITSLCLSLHRWRQLEDRLVAESPRSMTDASSGVRDLGLVATQKPPLARALLETRRSGMVNVPLSRTLVSVEARVRGLRSMADPKGPPCTDGPGRIVSAAAVSLVVVSAVASAAVLSSVLVSAVDPPVLPNPVLSNSSGRTPSLTTTLSPSPSPSAAHKAHSPSYCLITLTDRGRQTA
jgi:hypothetical protein